MGGGLCLKKKINNLDDWPYHNLDLTPTNFCIFLRDLSFPFSSLIIIIINILSTPFHYLFESFYIIFKH